MDHSLASMLTKLRLMVKRQNRLGRLHRQPITARSIPGNATAKESFYLKEQPPAAARVFIKPGYQLDQDFTPPYLIP
ncbi:hypothetical protein PGT21_006672 [Puccinia graminis f. sp. tritici]|uniref:Uncharacterized protein n=1 Tax=Puccinia graminis f. sp. tritici TaxID=56615 RepID=A0A5B0P8U6_PUCGR|nr:hypothetical protein PGT21_006672 [Puccinia graminis f. sp. tritici]KAA1134206.1 hypothetical protein PGTUg99_032478 [Puccinia graminis f. sp. tritici]